MNLINDNRVSRVERDEKATQTSASLRLRRTGSRIRGSKHSNLAPGSPQRSSAGSYSSSGGWNSVPESPEHDSSAESHKQEPEKGEYGLNLRAIRICVALTVIILALSVWFFFGSTTKETQVTIGDFSGLPNLTSFEERERKSFEEERLENSEQKTFENPSENFKIGKEEPLEEKNLGTSEQNEQKTLQDSSGISIKEEEKLLEEAQVENSEQNEQKSLEDSSETLNKEGEKTLEEQQLENSEQNEQKTLEDWLQTSKREEEKLLEDQEEWEL